MFFTVFLLLFNFTSKGYIMKMIRLWRMDGKIINIHPFNIVNMVTKGDFTYIQLGNMDNIKGILL